MDSERYLEKLELYLDLNQPVDENSSHLERRGCENIKSKCSGNLLVDGAADQVVGFNSTKRLHSPEEET